MGYHVEYGNLKKIRGMEKRFSRMPALTALFLLLFCLMVNHFWPEGAAVMRKLVFPGDPAVTVSAFENMTQHLQEGEPLSEALRCFCTSVLEGAGFGKGR